MVILTPNEVRTVKEALWVHIAALDKGHGPHFVTKAAEVAALIKRLEDHANPCKDNAASGGAS